MPDVSWSRIDVDGKTYQIEKRSILEQVSANSRRVVARFPEPSIAVRRAVERESDARGIESLQTVEDWDAVYLDYKIGAAVVENGRIWVGFTFFEKPGEFAGYGGIGWFDPAARQWGCGVTSRSRARQSVRSPSPRNESSRSHRGMRETIWFPPVS